MMYRTVPKVEVIVVQSLCNQLFTYVPVYSLLVRRIMLNRLRLLLMPLAAAALMAAPPPPGAVPTRIILTWTGDPSAPKAWAAAGFQPVVTSRTSGRLPLLATVVLVASVETEKAA